MTTTINIHGIEVDVTIVHNSLDKVARIEASIQDGSVAENLEYTPCAPGFEFEAYRDQFIDELSGWVKIVKTSALTRHISNVIEFVTRHNMTQDQTKISAELSSIENDVLITVWGNFTCKSDRVGEILHSFYCPVFGENEYNIEGSEDAYDICNVVEEIKKVV